MSDFATVLQVGKSVLSGTAAELANDPQVQRAYLGTGRYWRGPFGDIMRDKPVRRLERSQGKLRG